MAQEARGFTLVEMMVVVAVLVVTLTLGVPAFAATVQWAREANTYHLLSASLASARVSSMTGGMPVTVCPSADGAACRTDLVWEDGWIVYADPERSQQPAVDAVLQHVDARGSGVAIRSTRGRHRVRFTPDGWSYGSNLSIRVCRMRDAVLRGKVVVNNAGRPRVERAAGPEACPFRL